MTGLGLAGGTAPTAAELAAAAEAEVLGDLGRTGPRGVVVDSPPGAGKSTLVVRAAVQLASAGEPVMVVAQTNSQVDDLVDRLAVAAPGLLIGRLSGLDYLPTPLVARHGPAVVVSSKVRDVHGCHIVAGTAAKWAMTGDGLWRWAVIDEAYQMRSDLLLRVAGRFRRALFVGDPGQLDPFSTIETERWTGLPWDPMLSAVAVLLRNNPDVPVRQLPVSWRLHESAARVVADAFYPFSGFASGAGERAVSFATRVLRSGPVDEALDLAAGSGWALYELPARHTVRTDAEAVEACVSVAERALQRGMVCCSERAPGGEAMPPGRIAIGTAHRDQAQAVRERLGPLASSGVVVDTANRLQGREFDLVVVLHPLSGRRDATTFHLEAGRLCVLTSRHRHACIVVARAGIAELLDAHPCTEPVHLGVPARFPDGWAANQAMLSHLANWRVRAL
jgi:hypothetical protein